MTRAQVLALLDKAPPRLEGITFVRMPYTRFGAWAGVAQGRWCGVPGHDHRAATDVGRHGAWTAAINCQRNPMRWRHAG